MSALLRFRQLTLPASDVRSLSYGFIRSLSSNQLMYKHGFVPNFGMVAGRKADGLRARMCSKMS